METSGKLYKVLEGRDMIRRVLQDDLKKLEERIAQKQEAVEEAAAAYVKDQAGKIGIFEGSVLMDTLRNERIRRLRKFYRYTGVRSGVCRKVDTGSGDCGVWQG